MTGDITPSSAPSVISPNDPDHRRDDNPSRRNRHVPHPPRQHQTDLDELAGVEPETPSYIGTRINVRV
jgi:hypothetical protein